MAAPPEQHDAAPLYALDNVSRRRSHKFNVDERVYNFTMAPFPAGLSYGAIHDRLHRLFEGLLSELLLHENGEPLYPNTDRVRLSINSPDLSHAIWIAFVPPR